MVFYLSSYSHLIPLYHQVTLDIGGTAYELSVPIDPANSSSSNSIKQRTENVARMFCHAHAEEFQLSESNMDEYCVDPVSTYLQKAVVDEAAASSSSAASTPPAADTAVSPADRDSIGRNTESVDEDEDEAATLIEI